ncbi:MAG: NUDIX domain-containing protein [Flavipsychrobacter sp.]|nr:NUDIX domain-containing protein [Flavipsychrobacter sp.]
MYFGQKIYYNNKPLILTTNVAKYIAEHPIAEGYLAFEGAFSRNYRLALDHLDKLTSLGAIIEDESPMALQDELHKQYKPIDAGGGVVKNEKGEILMIFRRGKWDLPKGKRDDGETMEDCAVREVTEETGLQRITNGKLICETYHIYSQYKKNLLKRTAWYHMTASSTEQLHPQLEENILEARWIAEKNIGPIVFKSYEAIREVLMKAGLKW